MDKENTHSHRRRSTVQIPTKGILRDTGDTTWPPSRGLHDIDNTLESLNHTVSAYQPQPTVKRSKSLRRVSFAPKTHVRELADGEKKSIENAASESSHNSDTTTTTSTDSYVTSKFDFPDLSSVRRQSGDFKNIRLSIGGITHSDISYEEDLKGSPAPHEENGYNSGGSNILSPHGPHTADLPSIPPADPPQIKVPARKTRQSIAPASNNRLPAAPDKFLNPSNEKIPHKTRDSIAFFFDENSQAQPNFTAPVKDDFETDDDVEMPDATQTVMIRNPLLPADGKQAVWQGYPEVPVDEEFMTSAVPPEASSDSDNTHVAVSSIVPEALDVLQHNRGGNTSESDLDWDSPTGTEATPMDFTFEINPDLTLTSDGEFLSTSPQLYNPLTDDTIDKLYDSAVLNKSSLLQNIEQYGFDDTMRSLIDYKDPTTDAKPLRSEAYYTELQDDTINRFFCGKDDNTNQLDIPLVDDNFLPVRSSIDMNGCILQSPIEVYKDDTTSYNIGNLGMPNTPTQSFPRHRGAAIQPLSIPNAPDMIDDGFEGGDIASSPVEPLKEQESESTIVVNADKNDAPSPDGMKATSFIQPHEIETRLDKSTLSLDVGNDSIVHFHDEGNIMDERPIIDESFADETKAVTTVKEFLQAAGIYFQDNLTTHLRRETSAYLRTETASDLEYYKAAFLWSSELDAFEYGCQELQQDVRDMREELKQIEDEAEANPPPIFYDVCDGDSTDQAQIQQCLKVTKSFARTEAKENWHTWRCKVLNDLSEDYTCNLRGLQKDHRTIKRFTDGFSALVANARRLHGEMLQETQDMEKRLEDERLADIQHMAALEKREEQQHEQIQQLKAEAEQLRLLCEKEQVRETNLLETRDTLITAIESAANVCKELMIFDPEELATLRDEYKLLASLFPWTSVQVSGHRYVLAYDHAVQLTVTKTDGNLYSFEVSILPEQKKSSLLNFIPAPVEGGRTVLHGLGRDNVMRVLKHTQLQLELYRSAMDFSKVIILVACVWNGLRKLYHDVERVREEFDVQFVHPQLAESKDDASLDSRDLRSIGLSSTFFCRRAPVCFDVIIWIASSGAGEVYPIGRWEWEANVAYGPISRQEIDNVLTAMPATSERLISALRALDSLASSGGH